MELVELEAAAYRAWPAAEIVGLGDWRLRFTSGVTRRANSAWTYGASGEPSGASIERVEAFYADRGRPALFQVGPLSEPADLDGRLAARGYRIDAPVSLQTAPARVVAGSGREAPWNAEVGSAPDADWCALAVAGSRFRNHPEVYRALLARIPGPLGYARVRHRGETVASGLGVADGTRLGVYSMLTAPSQRGRGLGRAVLAALGDFALGVGADQLYLQVERDNPPALALYAGAGFREVGGYHYRVSAGA